jgi:ribonuclease D
VKGLDLAPFLENLSRQRLLLHGADYDLRLLYRGYGFAPVWVFDTMLAAQLLGENEIGLAALLQRRLGVTLDKSLQRADWSERPLTPDLVAYAAADVSYLHELMASLEADLRAKDRLAWHEEECTRVVAAARIQKERDHAQDWRIKGTNGLTNRERAFARALWEARDERSREIDRPAFRVYTNERLLEAAKLAAKGERDPESLLQSRRGLPSSLASAIRSAVATAATLPAQEWPGPKRDGEPVDIDPVLKQEIERLKTFRERLAVSLDIDPGVLASRPFLTALGRARLKNPQADAESLAKEAGISLWRTRLLLEAAGR